MSLFRDFSDSSELRFFFFSSLDEFEEAEFDRSITEESISVESCDKGRNLGSMLVSDLECFKYALSAIKSLFACFE